MDRSHMVFHDRDIMQVLGGFIVTSTQNRRAFVETCKLWREVYYSRLSRIFKKADFPNCNATNCVKHLFTLGRFDAIKLCMQRDANIYLNNATVGYLCMGGHSNSEVAIFIAQMHNLRKCLHSGTAIYYGLANLPEKHNSELGKFLERAGIIEKCNYVTSVLCLDYTDLLLRTLKPIVDTLPDTSKWNLYKTFLQNPMKYPAKSLKFILEYVTPLLKDFQEFCLPDRKRTVEQFDAMCQRCSKTMTTQLYVEAFSCYAVNGTAPVATLSDAHWDVYMQAGLCMDNFVEQLFLVMDNTWKGDLPKLIKYLIETDMIDPCDAQRYFYRGMPCCKCSIAALCIHKGYEDSYAMILENPEFDVRDHFATLVNGIKHRRFDQCQSLVDKFKTPDDVRNAQFYIRGAQYTSRAKNLKPYKRIIKMLDVQHKKLCGFEPSTKKRKV